MSSDNYVSPLGLDVETLESSFNLLAPQADELVRRFYEKLFKDYPEVEPLFSNTDPSEQQKKLLASLKLVIENVRKPEALAPVLTAMGERHQQYGVKTEHYPAVAMTLIAVMKEMAGDAWNFTIESAWSQALGVIAKIMIDAYIPVSNDIYKKQITNAQSPGVAQMNTPINDDETVELARLRSAVGGAMQAMMMIDRDFNITYVNRATIDLLTKHQFVLQSVYPGFSAQNIVGVCIDIFHKNPAHQRQMLNDPNNLPYSANIQVAHLSFKLNVTAMVDPTGQYIGNTLEWSDITEILQKRIM